MNIIQSSTKMISSQFTSLEKELAEPDYLVSFEGFIFELCSPDKAFTIKDLQYVVDFHIKPEGILETCTFEEVRQTINGYLAFTTTNKVEEMNCYGFTNASPKIAAHRKQAFWDIITVEFPIPPTKCLKHHPEPQSYFSRFMMWQFTFCLFNRDKGLVIHGRAYD